MGNGVLKRGGREVVILGDGYEAGDLGEVENRYAERSWGR